jgi:peptide/nickel transport system ATP-binding protein
LNPVFTIGKQVRDVCRYGGRFAKKISTKEADRITYNILREVRLPEPNRVMRSYPYQLSGGMRQRVLIALALVNEPRLVIEDEPGTALDVTVQSQILELIDNLVKVRGVSTILITHNLGVIRESTDFANIMYGGNIVESARTKNLFASPKHFYTRALLGCVPKLTREGIPKGINGMIPDYTRPPNGCRYHPRCDHAIKTCRERPPTMRQAGDRHQVACYLYREL